MSFAKRLRKGQIKKNDTFSRYFELVLVLDNVYDTYNVGGLYRVADAAGVSQIIHAGNTPVPPNPKITRAAVGLDQYIRHKHEKDVLATIKKFQVSGFRIVVLEQSKNSKHFDQVDYRELLNPKSKINHPKPSGLVLVVGNETFGVSKPALKLADLVVELPMYGTNKSLNVVVAAGIVLYEIRRKVITQNEKSKTTTNNS